jgi:predicted GIY-YIG superfamily endonuclease
MADWALYIVENKGCTYVGVSPDPLRRLRQHNGEISGGAKYTISKGQGWKHLCLVRGFKDKIQAMQFEWAVKHVKPRDTGGPTNRLKKLCVVLNSEKWTSKAPLASTIPLEVEWKTNIDFGEYTLPEYVTQVAYIGSDLL